MLSKDVAILQFVMMIHILHCKKKYFKTRLSFKSDTFILCSLYHNVTSKSCRIFLPLLSYWFLQNISFSNSPFHPFLPSLSNFFTTHILVSVSFFRRVLFSAWFLFFQSPYYWPSQHHTPDNIEWVPTCFSRLCWFDISKNPSTSVDISKTVSVEISRYAIYLYKRGQRNKKIHGLEPGLPVCSLFSQA